MRGLLILVLLLLLIGGGFVWNEARKEVVYLCGNFGAGVRQDSVLRQLGTGEFLRFQIDGSAEGSRIVVDSAYNLSMFRCEIDLDANGRVVQAGVVSDLLP